MRKIFSIAVPRLLLLPALLLLSLSGFSAPLQPGLETAPYEFRPPHPDGIGKIYFGREIAHVMGHQAADWLERPEREQEERPDLLIEALEIQPGDMVADIGAGTGYFSWRLARRLGETGKVYAVDIQPEMLARLERQMDKLGVKNVEPVLGKITDPQLPPASVDWVIMVDVYHEFSHPYEMVEAICHALKPGGRIVFVEYRGEDPEVPIKPLHKMTAAQIKKEMEIHPLTWEKTIPILPRQHIILFQKTE
jgi:ubiquinone/menaquinone biosynthesis C-methylase UbiE